MCIVGLLSCSGTSLALVLVYLFPLFCTNELAVTGGATAFWLFPPSLIVFRHSQKGEILCEKRQSDIVSRDKSRTLERSCMSRDCARPVERKNGRQLAEAMGEITP